MSPRQQNVCVVEASSAGRTFVTKHIEAAPMVRKVLVGYGVDVDAVANWINTKDGTEADPVNVSRGIFGATVGVNRLLQLFQKNNIKASWYVPAHSAESFAAQIHKIVEGGHEIGLHGYTHEYVSGLSEQQECDVLSKSVEILSKLTGRKPRGWTAPAWTTSSRTVKLLEESGIEYDHSFMHHDCLIYQTPYSDYGNVPTVYSASHTQPNEAKAWMQPMPEPINSSIVTVPANWQLDDWPPFQPRGGGSNGFVDPYVVEKMWKDHFEYCYEQYEEFVFPISIHPQVSGKPQVLMMHQRMIDWLKDFEGVEWCTFEQMVDQYKAGHCRWDVVDGINGKE